MSYWNIHTRFKLDLRLRSTVAPHSVMLGQRQGLSQAPLHLPNFTLKLQFETLIPFYIKVTLKSLKKMYV